MKKCLIVRFGAYGDNLILTPVIRELKRQGYYIIMNTSERGEEIFRNNPNIDEIIFYKTNSKKNDELEVYWDELKEKIKPDKYINFSESLEIAIALHPASPRYNLPKNERMKYANINYYEYSFQFGEIEREIEDFGRRINGRDIYEFYKPQIFFTEDEETWAKSKFNKETFNIVWGLSGSGKNKCYPWTDHIINNILSLYGNKVKFFLVGDNSCKILEYGWHKHKSVECLSGEISMRKSIALTKYADLVVAPDTGLLHGSGCFETPKIGLLGHTTKENITKYFENDYSIQSDPSKAECAPCSRIIYDLNSQCPIEEESNSAWCMYYGLDAKKVESQISGIIRKKK